jgi:UDP:flavonoid glycosyltransferase YjiC (YdhE family)
MKKYLFTILPSNDLGLLARSLPIALELKNRGHQVDFCSQAKAPKKLISTAGFENLDLKWPLLEIMSGDAGFKKLVGLMKSAHFFRDTGILISFVRQMMRSGTAEIWNLDQFMYLLGMRFEKYIRAYVGAMIGLIDETRPDVIVDFWNPIACIAAKIKRKPLVTVIQADLHPLSDGFIWWKQPPPDLPTPVRAVNMILSEYGIKAIQKTGELLTGDKTLVVGIPETDPLPDAADVTYIGPILWQKPDETLPDWIKKMGKDQPVVWLYPGNLQYMKGSRTSFDGSVVLRACIKALGGEPIQVVFTSGHQSLPRAFLPLPLNFHHLPFVPGLAMAEKSDLLIHHGGYASCQTGLYTGKPALIIPTFSERESNARRIAGQGAGDFILPETDASGVKKYVKAEDVRSKVFNILANRSFSENAERIGAKVRGLGGAAYAAGLIDNFI